MQTTFRNLILLEYGKPLPDNLRSENGLYPVYGANGVKDRSNEYLYDCPTLIIGRKGSAGEINLSEDKFWPLDVTYFVKFDVKILDLHYLYYLLRKQNLPLLAKGVKPGLNREDVYNISVAIPSLDQQKRIAERLDKVQELIALQKEQLKKLDDLIKSRFIDLFGDPITNSKKFKIDTLNNICDVRDGTHASPEYVLKGYPLITSKNIINGEISLEEVNFITKLDFDNINKRSKVDVGDILLPMIGTIGNPALVEQEPNYAIKNMALIKFWPQSRCSNLYILYLLRSSFLDNIIKNQQRGGTQKFLALKTIRGLQIPIPPISSQVQFADFVAKIEKQKGLLATRLSHLETLYKSLMQEYFG